MSDLDRIKEHLKEAKVSDLDRIKEHFKKHSSLAPSQIQWLIEEVEYLSRKKAEGVKVRYDPPTFVPSTINPCARFDHEFFGDSRVCCNCNRVIPEETED